MLFVINLYQSILDKCNFTTQYLSNGDDTYQLGKGDESNFQVIDTIGDYGDDPGDGWDVCGVTEGTKEHTLIKKDDKAGTDDWNESVGTSADDCFWIVKDRDDWDNLGVHTWNGTEAGGGSGGGGSGGEAPAVEAPVVVLEAAVLPRLLLIISV